MNWRLKLKLNFGELLKVCASMREDWRSSPTRHFQSVQWNQKIEQFTVLDGVLNHFNFTGRGRKEERDQTAGQSPSESKGLQASGWGSCEWWFFVMVFISKLYREKRSYPLRNSFGLWIILSILVCWGRMLLTKRHIYL